MLVFGGPHRRSAGTTFPITHVVNKTELSFVLYKYMHYVLALDGP